MSPSDLSPADRFIHLSERLASEPGVQPPGAGGRGFGQQTLRVDGRIFAMRDGDDLVVRLPPARVEALCTAGAAAPYANGARTMRGWARVGDVGAWERLAREALDHASGASGR